MLDATAARPKAKAIKLAATAPQPGLTAERKRVEALADAAVQPARRAARIRLKRREPPAPQRLVARLPLGAARQAPVRQMPTRAGVAPQWHRRALAHPQRAIVWPPHLTGKRRAQPGRPLRLRRHHRPQPRLGPYKQVPPPAQRRRAKGPSAHPTSRLRARPKRPIRHRRRHRFQLKHRLHKPMQPFRSNP
jgi:hypothetical protein